MTTQRPTREEREDQLRQLHAAEDAWVDRQIKSGLLSHRQLAENIGNGSCRIMPGGIRLWSDGTTERA